MKVEYAKGGLGKKMTNEKRLARRGRGKTRGSRTTRRNVEKRNNGRAKAGAKPRIKKRLGLRNKRGGRKNQSS